MSRKLLLSCLFTLLFTSQLFAQRWANRLFTETKHDFGTVARGADVVHKFEIKNVFEEDIEILGVRSSCGCTTPTIENKYLKTWEKGYLVARFNTHTFQGHKAATLTVTLAFHGKDGIKRFEEMRVRVSGTIRSDIVFSPGAVKYGRIDQGTVAEKKLSVVYQGRSDWKIVDVQSANPYLQVELKETGRQWGRVSYEITVRLKENAPAGILKDELILITNDFNNKRIPLDVEGRVIPEISVSPAPLVLGRVKQGEHVTKKFVVRGKKPFKITNVVCDGAGNCFTFKADTQSKAIHLVEVTFSTEGAAEGQVKRAIEIQTDRGKNVGAVLTAFATITPSDKPEKEQPKTETQPVSENTNKDVTQNKDKSSTEKNSAAQANKNTPDSSDWKPRKNIASRENNSAS